jgi:pilus assembly protein Flp/PilA
MLDYVLIRLRAMHRNERGASAVEYGLLVALIAIAIIVAITFLGGALDTIFNQTATKVNDASATS